LWPILCNILVLISKGLQNAVKWFRGPADRGGRRTIHSPLFTLSILKPSLLTSLSRCWHSWGKGDDRIENARARVRRRRSDLLSLPIVCICDKKIEKRFRRQRRRNSVLSDMAKDRERDVNRKKEKTRDGEGSLIAFVDAGTDGGHFARVIS